MRPARAALLALCLAGSWPSPARADDPRALFDAAQRADLAGAGQAALAFSLFRRAAEAGLAEAEFNVAVMLDSGRGTGQDLAEAATWYARAALHGSRRAAYDLAQLYDAGQGVPRNGALAAAWFAASDLPAARGRRVAPDGREAADPALAGPVPVSPAPGALVAGGAGGLALVWTSRPQPEPVRFLVELRALDASGSREVFSGETDLSGSLADLDGREGAYAWRVSAVAEGTGRYRPSGWIRFRLGPAGTSAR